MRRLTVIVLLAAAFAIATVGVVFVRDLVADPPSASCQAPPTAFGPSISVAGHHQIAIDYVCAGASQSGTLYLSAGPGPYPVAVWVHGAGPATSLSFGGVIAPLVDSGVAVFSYDKRGVGESQGACCPGDNGHFNLLTADVVGAIAALASRSDVRRDEIGLIGASQAGWIAPKATVDSGKVAFIALASATPVSERLTNTYERLARGDEGRLAKDEISRRLATAGASGFDPLPFLQQMTVPSLWMFGTEDDRVPVTESIALLDQLKSRGKDITIVTFPGAGHGLLDTPPSAPNAPPTLVDWILKHVHPASRYAYVPLLECRVTSHAPAAMRSALETSARSSDSA